MSLHNPNATDDEKIKWFIDGMEESLELWKEYKLNEIDVVNKMIFSFCALINYWMFYFIVGMC